MQLCFDFTVAEERLQTEGPSSKWLSLEVFLSALRKPFLHISDRLSVSVVRERRIPLDGGEFEESPPFQEPYFFIPRKFLLFFSLWSLPGSSWADRFDWFDGTL